MLGDLFNNPLSFLIWFAALIAAISVHEWAHAYVADRLGDPTPRLMGRLTFNPLAHLDPIGTIMLFLVKFGWGKPVQFDPFNLKYPRRDTALISLAGPASNLIFASFYSIILFILPRIIPLPLSFISGLVILLPPFIILNVNLAIFNLIPIHPLDGFKIVEGALPQELARQWSQLQNFGFILLLLFVFPIFGGTSPVLTIIYPVIQLILSLLLPQSRII